MNQLILVFDENLDIQKVIASSLKDSEISIINESNPDLFLKHLRDSDPNLIFISNLDSNQDYKICREIRNDTSLDKIPIILLLNAQDNVEDSLLSELRINSILRKPFEASMLKKQLSQFIDLDENFGNGPDEDDEDFKIDMSEIGSQLQEIKHAKSNSDKSLEETKLNKSIEKNDLNSELANLQAIEMDSILLENVLHYEDPRLAENDDGIDIEEKKLSEDVKLEAMKEEKIEIHEEEKDNEIEMENGFESYLKQDNSEETPNTVSLGKKSSSEGLEKLKKSGLEDQFAESRMFDRKEETLQKSLVELDDIDLEVNDFEEQKKTWERPDELDLYHKTPREGLADINLDDSDFHPEFPKNLSSFDDTNGLSLKKSNELSVDDYEISDEINYIESEVDFGQNPEGENQQDNVLLIDSESQDELKMGESEVFEKTEVNSISETKRTYDYEEDTEIKSMVQDSFNVQEEIEETGLDELEELSSQMAELESEEEDLEDEAEEAELELEEIDFEAEEAELEAEEAELEAEEAELEVEEIDFEAEEAELEAEEAELEREELNFENENEKEILKKSERLDLDEDVFESWDDAESAFMSFDRESKLEESISSDFDDDHENFEKTESYNFTEEELKEIVSSSVQKALEKSIASSLVELAVSELKTTVSEMDQDWA